MVEQLAINGKVKGSNPATSWGATTLNITKINTIILIAMYVKCRHRKYKRLD